MNKKNLAILTVSKQGVTQAKKLLIEMPEADIYTILSYSEPETITMTKGFVSVVQEIFNQYKTLLFIMASGIVVRTIAPLIKTKDVDPAVLVMDEQGLFVVSLLSGHLGGANEQSKLIAEYCNAIPVISTASDVSNKIAVDTIAMKLDAKMNSLEQAKRVTSLIVNGESVSINVPKNIVSSKENVAGSIIISNRVNLEISQIIPQNIIIGIGCKKDKSDEEIISAVDKELEKFNIRKDAIKHFATGWIKADEKGLIKAAKHFDVELKIIEKEKIQKVHNQFIGSDFVEKTIGVRSISAPSAFISSSTKGKFLLEKSKNSGITVSIYEEEIADAR